MKLSRVNTLLLIAVVLINGYIIVLPFTPSLVFWSQKHSPAKAKRLEHIVRSQPATPAPQVSVGNRLIIPSILLDEPIFEGKDESTLNKGLWHRPQSSTPDKGSNTVLVGHRFTYTNPRGTLYHLDKVKVQDILGLTWENKTYTYIVTEIKVVQAHEISIEAPTTEPQLTIYTCTPLWLPKDRLVVIARPETLNHE